MNNNASNAGGVGGDSLCDSQEQNLPALACPHSNRTAVLPPHTGQPDYFSSRSGPSVDPSISMHNVLPLSPLTSRPAQGQVYPITAGFGGQSFMMSAVLLADGSSVLIPAHQLLLASCCGNRLYFLKWIDKRKITDDFSLASAQS